MCLIDIFRWYEEGCCCYETVFSVTMLFSTIVNQNRCPLTIPEYKHMIKFSAGYIVVSEGGCTKYIKQVYFTSSLVFFVPLGLCI